MSAQDGMVRKVSRNFRIRDFAGETLMARFVRKIVVPLVRAWFSTCRVLIINERVYREYVLSDKPVVVGTWHRASIYFLYFFGPFRPMIMISQSKDGEILSQYAAGFGVIPARGSSSKGGRAALEHMRRYLEGGGKGCATVLDGPRGPAYVAKKGMMVLSKLTGAPFIPVIWSANRTLTLRDSWDKMTLPLPWSRVVIALGEPIHIAENTTKEEMERYRKLVEDRLNTMMVEVDRQCGYR